MRELQPLNSGTILMSVTELVGLLISAVCCPEIEKRFYQVFMLIINIMLYFTVFIVYMLYDQPITEMVLVLVGKVVVTV